VTLRRTLSIMLIVYGLSVITAFLAGATLVAHADPTSECILFSYAMDGKLHYGHEAYCETIGYLFLAVIVGCVTMFYVTYKHRRDVVEFYKSGQYAVKIHDEVLKLKNKYITLHGIGAVFVCCLTIALTAGYIETCNNLQEKILDKVLTKKASLSEGNYRDTVEEKYWDDNEFWRYNKEVRSKYAGGDSVANTYITCRNIFTDPGIHQQLHDSHKEKYGNYFGYWYKQDLDFDFNAMSKAVYTNVLVEASMAGGWLSVMLWVGSLIFMLIQRFYMKKNKQKDTDRLSLHSGMDGTIRKEDMSMISGSYYQDGNGTLSRGGTLRGSDRSVRSTRRRGDMDNLALSLHGVVTPSGPGGGMPFQQQPSYPSYPSNPGYPVPGAGYPAPAGYNPSFGVNQRQVQAVPPFQPDNHQLQYQSEPVNQSLLNRSYIKPTQPDTTYYEREQVETEIM